MASSYAISALTAIGTFNTGDLLVTVDVTDFTQAPTGTTKKSTIAQFTTFIHTNATFTGTTTTAAITATGTVTATTFAGSGASLTALNASNLASGTVPSARVTGSYTGITTVGTLSSLGVTGALTVGGQGVFTGNVSGSGYSDWTAGVRSQGITAYASGVGAEMQFASGNANFIGYNRGTSAYIPTRVLGSTVTIGNGTGGGNLILDATGDLTATNSLTLGDFLNATQLQISTSASRIVPGATSLSLRNHADSADNLLMTDAGVATLRNAIRSPLFQGTGTPTVASGAGYTVSISGTDTAGVVTITHGASTSGAECVVSFGSTKATAPVAIVQPGPQGFAAGTYTTTGFTISSTTAWSGTVTVAYQVMG